MYLSAVGIRRFKVFWPWQGDGQAVKLFWFEMFERLGEASTTLWYTDEGPDPSSPGSIQLDFPPDDGHVGHNILLLLGRRQALGGPR